jgi:hypothetical protein
MDFSALFADAEVIHSYSRAQALADGVLIDVSETAREAGFKVPVALTAAVWADCVAWDREREVCPQDEAGRLWDVLSMAAFAARGRPDAAQVPFALLRVPCGRLRPELARLVLAIGPGDEGEPVITIMQPGED